jgi:hypothetical protein
MHEKLFKCGKPNCKCARGELHPGVVVKHYVGYERKTKKRRVHFCYIKKKDLSAWDEGRRIMHLLKKHE